MKKWEYQICKICYQHDKLFYNAPNWLWDKVVPKGKNIVCLSCFDKLCQIKDIDYAEHLTEVGFLGYRSLGTVSLKTIRI